MATQTKQRNTAKQEAPAQRQEVAVFEKPRLPWHPAIEERFGADKGQWKVLVEAIYPNAKTADSVVMALSYCRARNLDPFKRPVHIVPMWSSAKREMVETVWPSISEIRTTATRTGQYAGCDEAEFGPEITETFSGRVKTKEGWEDVSVTVTFPEWGRMVVYKIVGGQRCRFVGPKIHWEETKGCRGGSTVPNDMWENRPYDQFEKCVEAAALRRAFPEEVGNELTAEEMSGRVIEAESQDSRDTAPARPSREDASERPAREADPGPDPSTMKDITPKKESEEEQTAPAEEAAAEAQARELDGQYRQTMGGPPIDDDDPGPADDDTAAGDQEAKSPPKKGKNQTKAAPKKEPDKKATKEPPSPVPRGKFPLHWPDGKIVRYGSKEDWIEALKIAVRVNKQTWLHTKNQELARSLVEDEPAFEDRVNEVYEVLQDMEHGAGG